MTEPSNSSRTFQVDFEPVGRRIEVEAGTDLLQAAQRAGVHLASICGGVGLCDSCKVRLVEGELTPPTLQEREGIGEEALAAGLRLACQAIPLSDVKVDIPPESLTTTQRLQLEGREAEVEPDPAVIPLDVEFDPPGLQDLRSDETRIKAALRSQGVQDPVLRLPVLRELPEQLRASDWRARLGLRDAEVVTVLQPERDFLGLAVDVGTTKLALYLVDLSTGTTMTKTGVMNPQVGYGEDVVSRIAYANQNTEGRQILQKELLQAIDGAVESMCAELQACREQIVDAVVVGNTAMHHLFAGLPVRQLGMSPYVPAAAEPMDLPNSEVGLGLAPGAYIHLPPNIAGYVGADHVAMLLSTEIHRLGSTTVALDIGTNTEISLFHQGRLLSCSCASGPAFEGAHIHDGMRAAPGAIERVQIIEDEVHIQTIDLKPAVGICGSGILDAVAQMVAVSAVNPRGGLQRDHPLVRQSDGKQDFVLVPAERSGHHRDIVVTRKDINEIQLAKGAIRAGVEVLLEELGLSYGQIERFVVAGAFGTYLDLNSAIRVGMFPPLPLERFQQVGNAAGIGAKQMLVSKARRQAAAEIVGRVEYLELTTHPRFTDTFVEAMSFTPPA